MFAFRFVPTRHVSRERDRQRDGQGISRRRAFTRLVWRGPRGHESDHESNANAEPRLTESRRRSARRATRSSAPAARATFAVAPMVSSSPANSRGRLVRAVAPHSPAARLEYSPIWYPTVASGNVNITQPRRHAPAPHVSQGRLCLGPSTHCSGRPARARCRDGERLLLVDPTVAELTLRGWRDLTASDAYTSSSFYSGAAAPGTKRAAASRTTPTSSSSLSRQALLVVER